MADMYTSIRGTVIKSSDPAMGFAKLRPAIGGEGDFLIITSVSVQRKQITQYVKTLDDKVFGYAWGEGPGSISVQGMVFLGNCGSVNPAGIAAVNAYYDANNVYKKTSPISLSLGSAAFQGYLEELALGADMNEFNYGQFTLTMTIMKSGS